MIELTPVEVLDKAQYDFEIENQVKPAQLAIASQYFARLIIDKSDPNKYAADYLLQLDGVDRYNPGHIIPIVSRGFIKLNFTPLTMDCEPINDTVHHTMDDEGMLRQRGRFFATHFNSYRGYLRPTDNSEIDKLIDRLLGEPPLHEVGFEPAQKH